MGRKVVVKRLLVGIDGDKIDANNIFFNHAVDGVAAATANAICNATGVRLLALPFTPEKVYRALHAAREKAAA